jgi:hypothetical protein
MRGMTPLASVMLLAFFFLIAVALVVWALLAPRSEAPPRAEPAAKKTAREKDAPADAPRREASFSNDDVRGAKAPGPRRPSEHDDAFERFLRAGRDDDRT